MSDFLTNLLNRSLGEGLTIWPQRPFFFTPPPATTRFAPPAEPALPPTPFIPPLPTPDYAENGSVVGSASPTPGSLPAPIPSSPSSHPDVVPTPPLMPSPASPILPPPVAAATSQPLTMGEPMGSHQQPAVSNQQLAVSSQQSTVSSEQPSVSSYQSSAISYRPSVVSPQPSAINYRPFPIPNLQFPIPNLQSPISPPVIQVTIGRLEVRATPPPAKTAPSARPAPPVVSLEEYLRQRREGGSR